MTAQSAPELTELAADRALLGRSGTAERVAAALRERITQGLFRPGARLSEEHIGRALGVSRNTLREAFRLLTHERLLVHRLNRGTFVRVLDPGDIADIYHVRRLVECTALRGLGAPPYPLEAMSGSGARRAGGGADRRLDGVRYRRHPFPPGARRPRRQPAHRRPDARRARRTPAGLPRHGRSPPLPRALPHPQPGDPGRRWRPGTPRVPSACSASTSRTPAVS